jgi:hypothetical protein
MQKLSTIAMSNRCEVHWMLINQKRMRRGRLASEENDSELKSVPVIFIAQNYNVEYYDL